MIWAGFDRDRDRDRDLDLGLRCSLFVFHLSSFQISPPLIGIRLWLRTHTMYNLPISLIRTQLKIQEIRGMVSN
jgi:hypothetical protein